MHQMRPNAASLDLQATRKLLDGLESLLKEIRATEDPRVFVLGLKILQQQSENVSKLVAE
ncbi:MAG TPA: hypothetical protein DEQ47_15590 [Solibacterales bacterium]|nr:hypothetical protein [Bryobacterales bacterium]